MPKSLSRLMMFCKCNGIILTLKNAIIFKREANNSLNIVSVTENTLLQTDSSRHIVPTFMHILLINCVQLTADDAEQTMDVSIYFGVSISRKKSRWQCTRAVNNVM